MGGGGGASGGVGAPTRGIQVRAGVPVSYWVPRALHPRALQWLHFSLASHQCTWMGSPEVCHPPPRLSSGRPSGPHHPQTPCFSLLLLADDQTRVILSLLQEEGHGDYINGNFIRVRLRVRKGAEAVEVTAEPR